MPLVPDCARAMPMLVRASSAASRLTCSIPASALWLALLAATSSALPAIWKVPARRRPSSSTAARSAPPSGSATRRERLASKSTMAPYIPACSIAFSAPVRPESSASARATSLDVRRASFCRNSESDRSTRSMRTPESGVPGSSPIPLVAATSAMLTVRRAYSGFPALAIFCAVSSSALRAAIAPLLPMLSRLDIA